MGAAFDGDGDRVVFVDHRGAVVNGDAVLLIAARRLAAAGRLSGEAVRVPWRLLLEYGMYGFDHGSLMLRIGGDLVCRRYLRHRLFRHMLRRGGMPG